MNCSNKPKKYQDLTDKDYKHESDLVNGDTIYYKTAETENEHQKFSELDSTDKEFINNCKDLADSLLKTNIPSSSIKNYTPEQLDYLIDLYNSKKLRCSQNAFVNSIGVAMGGFLVDKLGMKWTIVEDKYGRDYGTTIEEIKLTNFPLNSVLKAIEQNREGSMKSIYLMTLKNKTELIKKQ
jgi:hypothetical protein